MTTTDTYRRYRAKGYRAIDAYRIATHVPETIVQWDDFDTADFPAFMRAEIDHAGFTVRVDLTYDEVPRNPWDEDSYMGDWSYYTDYRYGNDNRDDRDNGAHVPYVHRVDTRDGYYLADMTATFREIYSDARTRGMSRSVARDYASAKVAEIVTYGREHVNEDRSYFGIVATILRDGIEISDASVWGFDHDVWNPDERGDLMSSVDDVVREALATVPENPTCPTCHQVLPR